MTEATTLTIGQVVGRQLREFREAEHDTTEMFAHRLRNRGLSWRRSTVMQVEGGARDVSIAELVLLSAELEVGMGDWFAGLPEHQLIRLTDDAVAPAGALTLALSGKPAPKWRSKPGWSTPGHESILEALRGMPAEHRDRERLVARIAAGEAEQKAARTLGITPRQVADLALQQWGHGLTEERDQRVADEASGKSARSIQALRGHVSRGLIKELDHQREWLGMMWQSDELGPGRGTR